MLLRLRQICNHTQLLCKRQINHINGIDNKEEIGNLNDFRISSKIEALVEFLNQNNDDDKSVVFSQWTSFLDLIEIAFKDANVKFVRFVIIEDQAIDRIYRIGQTQPVSVFRIFIENTIEDHMFEL
ncbi:unnamed protein product [Rhizophagus irregularis]|nr:unnamed protein product [Rhizophagus irregularis]CAB5304740.1 unnamed protein product [Rhizophagus irregularis]